MRLQSSDLYQKDNGYWSHKIVVCKWERVTIEGISHTESRNMLDSIVMELDKHSLQARTLIYP